jgi:hypothetical protein
MVNRRIALTQSDLNACRGVTVTGTHAPARRSAVPGHMDRPGDRRYRDTWTVAAMGGNRDACTHSAMGSVAA